MTTLEQSIANSRTVSCTLTTSVVVVDVSSLESELIPFPFAYETAEESGPSVEWDNDRTRDLLEDKGIKEQVLLTMLTRIEEEIGSRKAQLAKAKSLVVRMVYDEEGENPVVRIVAVGLGSLSKADEDAALAVARGYLHMAEDLRLTLAFRNARA